MGYTKSSQRILSIVTLLTLAGCISQPPLPDDPYYAPVMQPHEIPDTAQNGSLYAENTALGLFGDRKATRVGDIINVILQERTASKKTSNVELKKDHDIVMGGAAGDPVLFGTVPGLGNVGLGVDLASERDFKGEADADQSNQLTGNISVTVVDVYPNGTLLVRGEKWITLNRGDEYIRLSGLIRPDDVSPENTVISTKIANARIAYSGTGEFSDSQNMGWLGKFFNSPLWPF
ncbi:flagellar L-ring protein precursor FlgH [Alteromonadaceae bacterium 2753L.S.0a.02]|nr:flagellar L-ring protein precursor FlgH [Alteromonadaceae bacterium 2753L.S.0a.02]